MNQLATRQDNRQIALAVADSPPQWLASLRNEVMRNGQGLPVWVGSNPILPEQLSRVKSYAATLEQTLRRNAGDDVDIGVVVFELLVAYPAKDADELTSDARLNAYLKAVAKIPAWAVAKACERWLEGYGITGKENFSFAPTPSQLAIMARKLMEPVRATLHDCQMVMNAEMPRLMSADEKARSDENRRVMGLRMKGLSRWLAIPADQREGECQDFVERFVREHGDKETADG